MKARQFNPMIDEVAWLCLGRLIRGDTWRDIIVLAAIHIIHWVDNDRPIINKKKNNGKT